jgi:oligopeptide/dipeptide ABC transporter ATP-binding protein
MSQPLLRVSNLSIALHARPIVSDLSLVIEPATITGLFGESGCGKTTLALGILKLLPGEYCVEGTVRLGATDLLALSERELESIRGARVAMISQDPLLALNPVMRVRDQIEEVRRAHGVRAVEVPELFELVGLPESRRRAYPHELSGGERQRVLLAQALACRPSLVIADEPFTALDATRVLELSALFRELKEKLGTAFLLISHSPGVLTRAADEMLVMYAGRIVERGAVREVLRRPLHPYTAGLLRSLQPRDGRLYSIPGNPPTSGARGAGCPFEPRCDERMDRCRTGMPGEEVRDGGRSVRCFKYAG